jgi:hypothetical protein
MHLAEIVKLLVRNGGALDRNDGALDRIDSAPGWTSEALERNGGALGTTGISLAMFYVP